MKSVKKWKRITALVIAILMILSALPAAIAVPEDWEFLVLTLNRQDIEGNWLDPVQAVPLN